MPYCSYTSILQTFLYIHEIIILDNYFLFIKNFSTNYIVIFSQNRKLVFVNYFMYLEIDK